MLKQLGLLGHCKIRLMPDEDHEDIHFGCILHEKISSLIERKGLTSAHAKNESSIVDESEVSGLVYCLTKKLSEFCRELIEDDRGLDYQPSGFGGNSEWKRHCVCETLEDRNIVAWIGMKTTSSADQGT